MRVAALVPEAFGGRGGIALYDSDLLSALAEHGDCETVTALPRLIRDRVGGELPARLDFRVGAARGALSFLAEWLRLLADVRRYDLVVCGHVNLLPFAEALRLRAGVPLVLVIYGVDAWQAPARAMTARLCRRADAVIAISEFTRDRFAGWSGLGGERIFVLPNALHEWSYRPGGKPRYLEERYQLEGQKVVLTLGRLAAAERYKGVDEVLEVMPALLRDEPGLRYVVVGDGDDKRRLESRAKELGLAAKVTFTGWIDEVEKADHYRLADAFVMAGRGEGFGFVFLEAMACGTPVVASRVDGSREAVLDGDLGLLADPDNSEELHAAIVEALSRPRQVPEGLSYFHYPRFRERLGGILEAVGAARAKGP